MTVGEIVGVDVGDFDGDFVSVVGAADMLGLDEGATSKNAIGSFNKSTAHLH
jgi:hypothetical protein